MSPLDSCGSVIQPIHVTKTLSLGFSPCPNDTFMFHALVHDLVRIPDVRFETQMDDIEALNRRALGEASAPRLAISKVSASALAFLLDDYAVLGSGAALGRGVGPLVVTRPDEKLRSLADLSGKRIGVPGLRTTAYLLLSLFAPPDLEIVAMRFEQIMPRVASGELDGGLIIHESRFTYAEHGLVALADVGQLWEQDTGLPLPLGLIVARRELGPALVTSVERAIAESVGYAREHPSESAEYIRAHAQEMDPEVCERHIALYVNERSIDLGDEGRRAVEMLLARGAERGMLPRVRQRPFIG
jgi:1,4-dihydroxy-6-naphthoate synthase